MLRLPILDGNVSTAEDRQRGGKSIARFTVAFALLNVPFWLIGQTDFLSRPWFNVDLLVPLVLASTSLVWATLALSVLWALDTAVSQSLTWHFHSPFEFIRSIEFVPSLQLTGYLSTPTLVRTAAFTICCVTSLWVAQKVKRGMRPALLLLFVVALVDILNGSSLVWVSAERPLPGNFAGSAVKMAATSMLSRKHGRVQPLPAGTSLTSKLDILDFARTHPDRSIALFVIESMGLHNASSMRQALRDRLVDSRIVSRFNVSEFVVPFHGSTVAGELRELCGLEGNYRSLGEVSDLDCLPHRLIKLGFTTLGLHGFSHRMFMRDEWWSQIGLQHSLFAENLALPEQPRCGGAFVGICDADIVRRAIREARGSKHFVYTVTLESHLPLDTVPLDPALKCICDLEGTGEDVCALTSVVAATLDVLRVALLQQSHPPLVLIVGDHAPPFSLLSSRRQFSQTAVPGFVLVPKD